MPKTTPVPVELKMKVHECALINPAASHRWIAKQFGLHHKTVDKILKGPASGKYLTYGDLPQIQFKKLSAPTETSEIKDDKWTITLPKTRIHTLEELVEYFKIDLVLWEVERWVANKWEMGYKDKDDKAQVEQLYQVKAFLKKRKEVEDSRNEVEELKKLAETWSPSPEPHRVVCYPDDLLLEVNFPDAHLGKLAWGVETGHGNYDVKIAESVFWEALETILDRTRHHRFNQIIFVIGNDVLNSDDIEGRTTSGTYVSSDARYHKTFAAVRNLKIRATERLRKIAPVKIIVVPGNHDKLSSWHLGDSLECYFHNYTDVEIDNSPQVRKFHQHGQVGLMFTHGHKGKRTDYPLLMAAEQPQMWGTTKFREVHTGHTHMTKTDEQHGVRVRVLPALCAPDDWLAENAFVGNLRNAEGYVWSPNEGLIEQVYYTVPEAA
jgi:predicted phosphodiesterase